MTVHLSVDHPKDAKYTALTYCWGVPEILSTKRSNIEDHLRTRPWSSLPKTFQQAIEMTSVLGYKYIWIDCLCIMQHDAEEFAVQSSVMG
jgi:hypothetical protein